MIEIPLDQVPIDHEDAYEQYRHILSPERFNVLNMPGALNLTTDWNGDDSAPIPVEIEKQQSENSRNGVKGRPQQ